MLELAGFHMCHLVIGLLFSAWTIVTLAAEPRDVNALKLDLWSIQGMSAQSELPNQRLVPYRIGASVVMTNVLEVPHGDFAILDKSMDEPKNDLNWVKRDNWSMISSDGRLSMAPLLRFESERQTIEIAPRRHSLRIQYRLDFN